MKMFISSLIPLSTDQQTTYVQTEIVVTQYYYKQQLNYNKYYGNSIGDNLQQPLCTGTI